MWGSALRFTQVVAASHKPGMRHRGCSLDTSAARSRARGAVRARPRSLRRHCTLSCPAPCARKLPQAVAMSTWKNVGMTYLKYADLCATHVRNCLKEPAKTKAGTLSNMHARVMKWEGGKRSTPGAQAPTVSKPTSPLDCAESASPSNRPMPRPRSACCGRLLPALRSRRSRARTLPPPSHWSPPLSRARRDRREDRRGSRKVGGAASVVNRARAEGRGRRLGGTVERRWGRRAGWLSPVSRVSRTAAASYVQRARAGICGLDGGSGQGSACS